MEQNGNEIPGNTTEALPDGMPTGPDRRRANVRAVTQRAVLADNQNPDTGAGVNILAGMEKIRENMTSTDIRAETNALLNNLEGKDLSVWGINENGRDPDFDKLKPIYESLQATKRAAETGDSRRGRSILSIKGDNVAINRGLLETHFIELKKIAMPGDGLRGPQAEVKRKMLDNYWDTLLKFVSMNKDERMVMKTSVIYQDDALRTERTKKLCRDPENVKGAAKMVGVLGLGALLLLNGIRDYTAGRLSFVTAALLGMLFFLLKQDKKYGFLAGRDFNKAIGKDNFATGAEARTFAETVMRLSGEQKAHLQTMMAKRFKKLQKTDKDVTLEDLTNPKKSDGRPDNGKMIDPDLAQRFMKLSPKDALQLIGDLGGVAKKDIPIMGEYIGGYRELPKDAAVTLGDPNVQKQAESAAPGGVPTAPPPAESPKKAA